MYVFHTARFPGPLSQGFTWLVDSVGQRVQCDAESEIKAKLLLSTHTPYHPKRGAGDSMGPHIANYVCQALWVRVLVGPKYVAGGDES
mgnify:CR=1 FL=1